MSDTKLNSDAPLMEAVRAIEASQRRMAVVLSKDGSLLGTLTDGDVRRCLLAGGNLETPVSKAMNPNPLVAEQGSSNRYLLDMMQHGNVMVIPLIDSNRCFVRLVHLMDLAPDEQFGDVSGYSFAVIMAGGEGTRLRPLTEIIPKPMVDIGGVPLLERQIHRLVKAGLQRAYISVNYLSHIIEDHFGNGDSFGIEINYLREQEKLGTAGALSLLPEQPDKPVLVMNGDILTNSDFGSLLSYHEDHNAEITVAAVAYKVSIPFGVINANGPMITSVNEKPSQHFLCNAGIYAVSPESLTLVPNSVHFNMTDLVDACLAASHNVAVFPVHEFWSDIGTHADLEKARELFTKTA